MTSFNYFNPKQGQLALRRFGNKSPDPVSTQVNPSSRKGEHGTAAGAQRAMGRSDVFYMVHRLHETI